VRELGADVTIADEKHPSVRDLLLAINKALANGVTDGKPAASCGGTLFAQENILETASAVPRAMGAGRGGS
jgi:hypothetical protein